MVNVIRLYAMLRLLVANTIMQTDRRAVAMLKCQSVAAIVYSLSHNSVQRKALWSVRVY